MQCTLGRHRQYNMQPSHGQRPLEAQLQWTKITSNSNKLEGARESAYLRQVKWFKHYYYYYYNYTLREEKGREERAASLQREGKVHSGRDKDGYHTVEDRQKQNLMPCMVPHHHHHFWQAPLRVRSAERRHQSPEWTVLSQVNCIVHIKVAGFQILLNGFHPCNTRTSQWSRPVSCGGSC